MPKPLFDLAQLEHFPTQLPINAATQRRSASAVELAALQANVMEVHMRDIMCAMSLSYGSRGIEGVHLDAHGMSERIICRQQS